MAQSEDQQEDFADAFDFEEAFELEYRWAASCAESGATDGSACEAKKSAT